MDTMPAGRYYVGDLCYVLHERWDEFCDITIADRECLDGVFTLKDGTLFATFRTKWGDGCYTDDMGREYSVDAGLIGCVKVEDLDLHADGNFLNGGQVIEFATDFAVGEEDGKIWFGDVCIDTDPSYDDDEDLWGDDEEIV